MSKHVVHVSNMFVYDLHQVYICFLKQSLFLIELSTVFMLSMILFQNSKSCIHYMVHIYVYVYDIYILKLICI